MPEVIDVTTVAAPALSIQHEKFLTEYIKTGNATESYLVAFPEVTPRSASTLGARLLTKVDIQSQLARLRADVAARNGIKLDDMVQTFKRVMNADIRKVAAGGPDSWDDETALTVQSYDAGGPQSSEKVKLYDKLAAARELWDRLYPDQGKATAPTPGGNVTNVQINVDKALLDIRGLLAK